MISIIVPVYNSETTIERCIKSILNQTYKDIELILIDDGSVDQSSTICEKYADLDSRVRFVKQKNHGVSYTRNKGIELSQGEFIQFLDSDDYWEPQMSETLLKSALKYDADMVISGIREEDENYLYDRAPKRSVGCLVKELEKYNPEVFDGFILNSPCNKLYRKETLTADFQNDISLGEDLIFNLQNLSKMNRVSFVDKSLYHYVTNLEGLNRKYRDNEIQCAERLYLESIRFCNEVGLGEVSLTKISTVFIVFLFYGFSNLFTLSKFSAKDKYVILKEWVYNKNVQEAAKKAVVEKSYQKIALWMLRRKRVLSLIGLFTLRSMMR